QPGLVADLLARDHRTPPRFGAARRHAAPPARDSQHAVVHLAAPPIAGCAAPNVPARPPGAPRSPPRTRGCRGCSGNVAGPPLRSSSGCACSRRRNTRPRHVVMSADLPTPVSAGPVRALIAGWFSFVDGEATAGDMLAAAAVEQALTENGLAHDTA